MCELGVYYVMQPEPVVRHNPAPQKWPWSPHHRGGDIRRDRNTTLGRVLFHAPGGTGRAFHVPQAFRPPREYQAGPDFAS
jgi:hypothetical protein